MKVSRFDNLLGQQERLPAVVQEHQGIVDALNDGDFALAEQRLLTHLNKGFSLVSSQPDIYAQYFTA